MVQISSETRQVDELWKHAIIKQDVYYLKNSENIVTQTDTRISDKIFYYQSS